MKDEFALRNQLAATEAELSGADKVIANLRVENERLKQELSKANNEFGSETWDWPDLWQRIAKLKAIYGNASLEWECYRNALEKIVEKDGPGADLSPGGSCYEIAREALNKKTRPVTSG